MNLFTSSKEKRYWVLVALVFLAILIVLFVGSPLLSLFNDQNHQAILFVAGMILSGFAILAYGIKSKKIKREIGIILGLAAVFLMLFLRLGLSERSHVIEYSVLTLFVFMAFEERAKNSSTANSPIFNTLMFTLPVGVFDEGIQSLLPDRVFDINDVVFNTLVSISTVGILILIKWIRKKF